MNSNVERGRLAFRRWIEPLMRLEPDYREEQFELFGEQEMRDITIQCESVVTEWSGARRKVEATLRDVDVAQIVSELNVEEVLHCLDKDDIKRYMAEHGDD